ncbi:intracellular coagulation inhibitor 2 [Ixodes scapularis]|uniref:intracellular coagulation inhibitor 2 n=1 Tax=Ixodes scapularis TaxID=6945 RepID=UPI001C37F7AE|nr:intracellular coagulation inhibitor 2 [Ixodes scapularis]
MKVITAFLSVFVLCSAEDDDKLTVASNDLGMRLLPLLPSSPEENIFFSPYSLSIAMGMAYAGAGGETRQELHENLGYSRAGLPEEQVLDAYARQTQRHLSDPSNTTVDVANTAAIHLGLPLLNEYEAILRNSFNADLQKVDFVENGQGAVDVINSWVKDKTHNKIESLFSEPLDPLTRFVLLNAMYFKGTWKTEFQKRRTGQRSFFNGGVTQAQVDTMIGKIRIRHNSFNDMSVDVAELPYRGGDYSMVILLPQEKTGVEALKMNLTAGILKTILDRLVQRDVTVFLPKFKFESKYSLKEILQNMGIRRIFGGGADLSGISGDTSLHVFDVVQKAVVEVNEEGTEAAVVSAVIGGLRSGSFSGFEFEVDHPFLFFIRDTRSNAILFVGQVNHL